MLFVLFCTARGCDDFLDLFCSFLSVKATLPLTSLPGVHCITIAKYVFDEPLLSLHIQFLSNPYRLIWCHARCSAFFYGAKIGSHRYLTLSSSNLYTRVHKLSEAILFMHFWFVSAWSLVSVPLVRSFSLVLTC